MYRSSLHRILIGEIIMKWLNIITDITDGSKLFTKIIYELFSSEEDLKIYSTSTKKISKLLDNKMAVFNENLINLQKLVQKINIKDAEVYSYVPISESTDFKFKAIDSKADDFVRELNSSLVYIEPCKKYLNSDYVFTEKDYENIPELKDIPTPKQRFVYEIPFVTETSWDKLNVPKSLRHQFTVAMAMQRIQEDII